MALPEIVSVADVFAFAQITAENAGQTTLMTYIKGAVERLVRNYMGISITQGTYTHFLPMTGYDYPSEVLYTKEYPLRTVTSIREDINGRFGQPSGSFPATSALVAGDEFYIDYKTAGFSKFGLIRRINRLWPSNAGTVKIVYVAGWTAAELAGDVTDPELDARDIGLVVKQKSTVMFQNSLNVAERNGISSESLEGYSVSFVADNKNVLSLDDDMKAILQGFKRIRT